MPPPAEGFASRLFMGPALRTQPDRRLVTLVREGYEAAFEEIVRRYGRPLGRYAASIVGGRSEDVLQDAFARALPALQRDDAEIDLRPWLFRIVRNTALNDLRDSPPTPELLAEALIGGRDPAEELERREELADLMKRLQALPEPQRAAIVMRELEGLGHEEIAAALGLTDGGARQAIYRARQALRDGAGLLLPLPLVRLLIDHGGEAVGAGAGAGASGALAAGASAGGAGAGGALKLGVVAAVVAGSVGAGVAVQQSHRGNNVAGSGQATTLSSTPSPGGPPAAARLADAAISSSAAGLGEGGHGEDSGSRGGGPGSPSGGTVEVDSRRESSGPGPSLDPSGAGEGRGPRGRGHGGGGGRRGEHPEEGPDRHGGSSGRGGGPGAGSGRGGGSGTSGGHGGSGSGGGGELTSTGGTGNRGPGPDGGSGRGGSPGSGPGPGGEAEVIQSPPPPESTPGGSTSGGSGSSGGSGGSGDGSSSHGGSSGRGDGGEEPHS